MVQTEPAEGLSTDDAVGIAMPPGVALPATLPQSKLESYIKRKGDQDSKQKSSNTSEHHIKLYKNHPKPSKTI